MAKFIIERISNYFDGIDAEKSITISVKGIEFSGEDRVVIIPSEHEGEPITELGYKQGMIKEYVQYGDYHHCKEPYIVPTQYLSVLSEIVVPAHIEKIIIPETIRKIPDRPFKLEGNTIIEIVPENRFYIVENNEIKINIRK